MMKNSIEKKLNQFTEDINLLFNEFLAAKTMYDIGRSSIDDISDDVCISAIVGSDLHLEPIPMTYIKKYKNNYPFVILDVYHGKLVQLWNNLLEDIFCILIDQHMIGARKFTELKKQEVKIDFDSTVDLLQQLKDNLIDDFSFKEFSERQKIINKALNITNDGQDKLDNIRKNILLRNLIQHKEYEIDDYILKEIGCKTIRLYDDEGKIRDHKKGDKFTLSIPEIHNFKSSLLYVVQCWRAKL